MRKTTSQMAAICTTVALQLAACCSSTSAPVCDGIAEEAPSDAVIDPILDSRSADSDFVISSRLMAPLLCNEGDQTTPLAGFLPGTNQIVLGWVNEPATWESSQCQKTCGQEELADTAFSLLPVDGDAQTADLHYVGENQAGSQWSPDLAVSPYGGFAIVWQEGGWVKISSEGGWLEDPTDMTVKARIFDAQGEAVTDEIVLDVLPAEDADLTGVRPKVVALMDGAYVVFWEWPCPDNLAACPAKSETTGTPKIVLWSRLEPDGQPSVPVPLSDCFQEHVYFGGAAPLGGSDFVAVWEESNGELSPPPLSGPCQRGFSLRIVRGDTPEPEFRLTGPLWDWKSGPNVFPSGIAEGFVLVWSAHRTDAGDLPEISQFMGVMGMLFDGNGNALTSSIPIVSGLNPGDLIHWSPTIQRFSDNRFLLTYHDHPSQLDQPFTFTVILDQNLSPVGPKVMHGAECGYAYPGVSTVLSEERVGVFWRGLCPVEEILSNEPCAEHTSCLTGAILTIDDLLGQSVSDL